MIVATTTRNDRGIWRMAGGDGSRRGCFGRVGRLRSRPEHRLRARGAVQASVVFDGEGRAFVADLSGTVQAFSETGARLWSAQLPGGISATPAVHPTERSLFVGTHAGWVVALNSTTGVTRWRREIPTRSDPRILSDLLVLPATDAVVLSSWGGRFCALAAGSGEEKFAWEAGVSPCAGAAADGEERLYCIRAVTQRGVELVRVTGTGEETVLHVSPEDQRGARRALVAAAPVIDEARGVLYFVTPRDRGGILHAWALISDRLLWSRSLPQAVQATAAIRPDGVVLVADLGGSVLAVDPEGEVRFRYASGCEYLLAGAVADAGGTALVGDPVGVLHRIDLEGRGEAMFEFERSLQARPSFGPGGTLWVASTDHTVAVFGKRD